MVNMRIVSKIIGQLLILLAFLMLICVGMAFAYGEDDAMPFVWSEIGRAHV